MLAVSYLSSAPLFVPQSQADCSNPLTVFNPSTHICDTIPAGTQPPHLTEAAKQEFVKRIVPRPGSFPPDNLVMVNVLQRIAWKDDQTDVANRAISGGAKSDDIIAALQQARTNFPPIDPFALPSPTKAALPSTPVPEMPFYKKWQFWTAIGGAVVVGGIGAVALTRK